MKPVETTHAGEKALRELASLIWVSRNDGHPTAQVVLNCVSTCEVYVDQALWGLVDSSGVRDLQLGRYLIREHYIYALSWPGRFDLLGKGFGLHLRGERPGQEFSTLLELRNALAHGKGSLTSVQRQKPLKQLELQAQLTQKLDVQVQSGTLFVGDETRRRAISIARAYICALDKRVRSEYPDIDL